MALGRLAEEDPTFQVQTNEETGQTEISGMGELHLEVLVDRMMREFKVEANVGRPQVSYRETIRGTAEQVEGRFVRQTGGSGQYGIVYIDVEPAPGEGFDFVNKIKGGAVPTEFIPAVEKGVEDAMDNGPRAGYPVVDVRVTLTDGKYHDTDSSEIAFTRGRLAGAQGGADAGQAGSAGAGVRRRGGHPRGVHGRRHRRPQPPARSGAGHGAARERTGGQRLVPLAEMFGYATDLRSNTQGRATYTMQFDRYEEVPPNIAEKVVGGRAAGCVSGTETSLFAASSSGGRKTYILIGFALCGRATISERRRSNTKWRRPSSSAISPMSTSAPSVTSTTARRR